MREGFIQRINTLTFARFEGNKKNSWYTMLALQQQPQQKQQQQQLRATRRVKSTARPFVHLCLGRQGDSRGDPNTGLHPKRRGGEKEKEENLHCCCMSNMEDKAILMAVLRSALSCVSAPFHHFLLAPIACWSIRMSLRVGAESSRNK